LCLAVIMMMAWPLSIRAQDEQTPEQLKPFEPLVAKCRKWHSRDKGQAWERFFKEDFSKDPRRWRRVSRYARVKETDGVSELSVSAPRGGTIFLPIGPRVKGQFAIEMVARAAEDRAVPLSIMLGGDRGRGPGFQFSTLRGEGLHLLWTDTADHEEGGRFGPKSLGNDPKMVVKQKYRVRIEVRRSHITAFVDGKKIGRAPLSRRYDWTREHQPHVMTVVSRIVVSSFQIERYVPHKAEDQAAADAKAWKEIFGDATRQQIEAQAVELVQMLDHNKWAVREHSERLLYDIGRFAVPALREAAKREEAELKWRAVKILESFAPAKPPSSDDEG